MEKEIPVLLFGADPLFYIEWKLFIGDILSVKMHPQVKGKISFLFAPFLIH
jgi:hypothetical protein